MIEKVDAVRVPAPEIGGGGADSLADVAGGVESEPGLKDVGKVRELVRAVRR